MTATEKQGAAGDARARAGRIRELRKRMGLTQDQMGDKCGIRGWAVMRFESGRNKATSYESVASLAQGVGVNVDAMAKYLDGELSMDALLAGKAGAA